MDERIRLHQSLHGYADGHRLLGTSVHLKNRDAKTLLTLSDASGSTSALTDDGYLTGYPLAEDGFYALAKTWPAPEMPRPGCVWTHTLLIDFSDLALVSDLSVLTQLFVRPTGATPGSAYKSELTLDRLESLYQPLPPDGPAILRSLVDALYAHPGERIVSMRGEPKVREALACALWSQQWPRLRRSFRFCTSALSDRSTEAAPFDLQFVARSDRSARSRFAKLLDAERAASEHAPQWVDDAVNDICHGTNGSLRLLLREIGAELVGGRENFAPLCRLHRALRGRIVSQPAVAEAISLLDGPLAEAEARAIRNELVERIVTDPTGTMTEAELGFCIRHLALLDREARSRFAERLGRTIWQQAPELASALLMNDDEPGRSVAVDGIATASPARLLVAIANRPSMAREVLRRRHDLLFESDLWRSEPRVVEEALSILASSSVAPLRAINSMVDSENLALPALAARALGGTAVLRALLARFDARNDTEPPAGQNAWLAVCTSGNVVAQVLSEGTPHRAETLVALARHVQPDDVPNDIGEDPWAAAIRYATDDAGGSSRLFLCAWTLARALGRRSRSRADLAMSAFEEVYAATRMNTLTDDGWRVLEPVLPNSALWGDWDRARRVRVGIARLFVERELDPLTFARLVRDDDTWAEIANEVADVFFGRTYLRRVKRALEEAHTPSSRRRIKVIDALL